MCGILGLWRKNETAGEGDFNQMLDTLESRGPDGKGTQTLAQGRLTLGHRRLAIIDVSSAGAQPMSNANESIWLTYNGEIYNFKALRVELEKKGYQFKSNSDSEVIIHAYKEWGEECLLKLRGIFSFALWDDYKQLLFLARDHLGVKPLYYYMDQNVFIFASEPRAIIKYNKFDQQLDHDAFSLYLAYGNIPSEYSIYKGIKKLLPAHSLVFKKDKIVIHKYWSAEYNPVIFDFEEAEYKVRKKIEESIQLQSISDVPVGSLLSGGVDSTIITASLAKACKNISSFTIGFDEHESDESKYAKMVSETIGTSHHQQLITYSKACSLLPDIIAAYDEPFHLNGLFPFLMLSQLVQSKNYKVVLGGDGADEIFTGYLWYENFRRQQAAGHRGFNLKCLKSMLDRKKNRSPVETFFKYNGYLDHKNQYKIRGCSHNKVDEDFIYHILGRHWQNDFPPVLAAQFIDLNCFLVDHCLVKVDRASMANGVEVRVPFLDTELVELAFNIDHDIMFRSNERKYLLKKSMQSLFPAKMDMERKKGFSSPLQKWLNKGLRESGRKLLLEGGLCGNGLLDKRFLAENYDSLGSGNQILLLSAELWFKHWFENDPLSVENFSLEATQQISGY